MQPLEKSRNDKVHRYCCSNPNCQKVFSKPKIIKYYVCPSCQTIVDMTFENSKLIARKKPATPWKPKEITQIKKQEPETITSKQGTTIDEFALLEKPAAKEEFFETLVPVPMEEQSQQATTDNELASMENPEVKESVEKVEPAQMDEPNIVEVIVNKKSGLLESDYDQPFSLGTSDEQRETAKEQTGQSSEFKCQYYFGYLSQRNKQEVIPETCFGCLKSIECMMSEYNKTKETVEEIKKWYSFK
jgi:hypothetical protein